MANNANREPSTAPQPDKWYNLTLGSSFTDASSSSKFCTLRYEFKPASIDKSQPGSLIKTKDNRVTVEFQNNQPGKPKVTFEGSSEDYKDSDAVLFFDGQSFRLERLHRAVKRLRHLRLPGESSSASAAAAAASASDPLLRTPPHGKASSAKPLSVPPPSVTKTSLNSVVPGEGQHSYSDKRESRIVVLLWEYHSPNVVENSVHGCLSCRRLDRRCIFSMTQLRASLITPFGQAHTGDPLVLCPSHCGTLRAVFHRLLSVFT